jgi:hypothetical protein
MTIFKGIYPVDFYSAIIILIDYVSKCDSTKNHQIKKKHLLGFELGFPLEVIRYAMRRDAVSAWSLTD